MKISQAIREGCLLVPEQAHCEFFSVGRGTRKVKAACVLGAALVGACGAPPQFPPRATPEQRQQQAMEDLAKTFPDTDTATLIHPLTGQEGTLRSVVLKLNDFELWSRERIASWLCAAGH